MRKRSGLRGRAPSAPVLIFPAPAGPGIVQRSRVESGARRRLTELSTHLRTVCWICRCPCQVRSATFGLGCKRATPTAVTAPSTRARVRKTRQLQSASLNQLPTPRRWEFGRGAFRVGSYSLFSGSDAEAGDFSKDALPSPAGSVSTRLTAASCVRSAPRPSIVSASTPRPRPGRNATAACSGRRTRCRHSPRGSAAVLPRPA